jgi:hypothetical protein
MADYPSDMVSDLKSFHMIQRHGIPRRKFSFLVDYKDVYGIGSRGWDLINAYTFSNNRKHWRNSDLDRYLKIWLQRDLYGHRLEIKYHYPERKYWNWVEREVG